jgi:hypothetical protein
LVQKFARIKHIRNALDLPIILYGSEVWALRKKDSKRLSSIILNFLEEQPGTPLFDHKCNEQVLEELKTELVDEKLRRYKSNLLRHVTRMNSSRMAKIMLNCRPNGRRRLGRHLKRQLDEVCRGLTGDG